jgi:hypothetical protein
MFLPDRSAKSSTVKRSKTGKKKILKRINMSKCGLAALTFAMALLGAGRTAQAQARKPTILGS